MSKSKIFVSELVDDMAVETIFLVARKSVRETRNGDPYLCLTLQDRTGTVEARGWDNALQLDGRFEQDDFIALRGRTSTYRGELQITVADVERVSEGDIKLADYLPHSRWEAEQLFESLRELVDDHVTSGEIRRFLNALFDDDEWNRRYRRAPAAVSNHHAYLAGLLEHSLSMARLAVQMGRHYQCYYPGLVNTDLLVAGCVIHDMAKTEELSFRRSFEYTTKGRLVGHIARGAQMVSQVAKTLDPPLDEHLTTQLQHLVLSHHGKQEFGAPVTPKTPEAILLHHLDMIDSRMNMVWNAVSTLVDDEDTDDDWSDYQRNFGSSLYISGEAARGWQMDRNDAPAIGDGPGRHPDSTSGDKANEQPGDTAKTKATKKSSTDDKAEQNLQLFGD